MKKILMVGAAALMMLGLTQAAQARGKAEKVEIKFNDAVKSYVDKKGNHLDGSVKFFWADEKFSGKGGEELSAKGMTMQRGEQSERCVKALAEALITFQERAKAEGKNAVVDVRTYYDADTKSGSRNDCLCIGGHFNTRTTVKGRLANVRR